MIVIKFPELAVNHIEMLIREIVPDLIDIVFSADHVQDLEQIALFEVPPADFTHIPPVDTEENTINHRFSLKNIINLRKFQIKPYRS